MGACISSSLLPTWIVNDSDKVQAVISSISPSPKKFVFSKEHPAQHTKILIKELPASTEARVFDNCWNTSSTSKMSEPAFVDRTSTAKAEDFSDDASISSTVETSCYCSSTNLSDFGNLVSYDGLNKRATDRCNIGIQMLKAQIHFGANPNALSTHGDRTCLMVAVMANDFRFTKKLVEMGVDVNQTNLLGETALSIAVELQYHNLSSYLRSKGAADVVISMKEKLDVL